MNPIRQRRLKAELHKVVNEIKRHGDSYEFYRIQKNGYGEDIEPSLNVGSVDALFHVVKGHIIRNVSDGSNVRTKGNPYLLCSYDSVKAIKLAIGDYTIINDNKYIITELNNVEEFNMCYDISLERGLDSDD